eukprot:CAMPEP_0206419402 /NCGR_PEP_ID=MMETSP0324_2-20121206/91_1 /ASSEMBLY_ACC=CAM_ASM_000836 /TAXON_ID=2866 /ORGANISM="Crypthecodinium cohnii, Strain Seligo" /LENGTH=34 /DNA_ID= /DNA_START= /DNA_END= /DNA_ORIENTATION=
MTEVALAHTLLSFGKSRHRMPVGYWTSGQPSGST